ncbi:hypothetical protein ALC53_10084 [Atta colombica]|uniref:Uncharacterized protein n=1 Tax=Atta colombica TaxID=520822 RepID=A0A151I0N9_9HYME|nr:hypothetical protein ALC53_10084 [Atta colombica]
MALEANHSIETMEMQACSSYPLLFLLQHYAPNIRDSRTACTFRIELTLPQAGQRPASFPLFAASCILDVTSP